MKKKNLILHDASYSNEDDVVTDIDVYTNVLPEILQGDRHATILLPFSLPHVPRSHDAKKEKAQGGLAASYRQKDRCMDIIWRYNNAERP